jgi:hypothetical protein
MKVPDRLKTLGTWFLLLICFQFNASCDKDSRRKLNHKELMDQGSKLFAQYGCFTCHSLEGAKMYGPPLDEIYGKEIVVFRGDDTLTVTVDRDYLKRSILDPGFEKDSAYQNRTMSLPVINREDVNILVNYLMELAN